MDISDASGRRQKIGGRQALIKMLLRHFHVGTYVASEWRNSWLMVIFPQNVYQGAEQGEKIWNSTNYLP